MCMLFMIAVVCTMYSIVQCIVYNVYIVCISPFVSTDNSSGVFAYGVQSSLFYAHEHMYQV